MRKSPTPFFLFLLFISLFFPIQAQAQVTGSIIDSTGQALPFCNVMLVKSADSSVVTGTTTNETGNFFLEKKDTGNFRLLILYSGYEKYYSSSFLLSDNQPKYDAGKILLKGDAKILGAVQIVAQKPFMEQQLDRTVFNIENSVIASGNNALEVLKKLPGVTVDNNDNIQVRGKPGVLFMINGRTSYLSGADMANYLRSIDASQIEKIEVITNPSAKYDASGNAIINIVLIKNKNLGFNGQVEASHDQGFYDSNNAGITMNYRMKKWNFYATENYYRGEFYEDANRQTIFSRNGIPDATVLTDARVKYHGYWNYVNVGADFMPSDRQTIGFSAELSAGARTQYRTFDSHTYNSNSVLDSSQYTTGLQHDQQAYYTYGLNYKFNIDTTGKELSADFNYAPFATKAIRELSTDYYDESNVFTRNEKQKAILPTEVSIMAGQVDYVQPVGKKIRMETGIKGSIVSTDNNAQYFNLAQDVYVNDTTLTNHFLYDESIYSAYVNYSQELNKKLGFQVGFRGEETQAKGTQLANDSVFSRAYFNLFPSTFINWKVDSTNTLNFSYSRRIDRPNYGELNPFRFFQNPYTYNSGNPFLRPQMTDNFELTYIFRETFSTSVGYLHMTDVFTNVLHQEDSTHIFYNRTENLATYNSYNILFAATLPITNWLTSINSLNIFHDHYFGLEGDAGYSARRVTFIFNTLNTISLKKNWGIEVSFFYRNLNLNAIWMELPVSSLDIGVRKKFADGKGSVSISCNDIFRMGYQNGSAVYDNVNFHVTGRDDNRRVRVSLSWKLGKSQYERDEKRKSAEEELNRAK